MSLSVGILGFGPAGEFFHAPLVHATPGMELRLVVTGREERARLARDSYPGVEVVPTGEALLARADELDLVVVASPNRTHAPLATAALRAGLGVVVDKPLATTAAEGRALVEEARRLGGKLTVYQNRRWDGDFLTLQQLLGEGALGDVLRFENHFERWRPVPRENWRESPDPAEAGGLLFDLGSHLVDQALVLFGPVARVYAEMRRRRPGVQVDDDTFVALTHRSGVQSQLWMSAVAGQSGFRMRVLGTAGAYLKHGLDVQEDALRAGMRPGDPAWGEETPERWGHVGAGDDIRTVPTVRGDYPDYYRAVEAWMRGAGPVPVDPAGAVEALEVLEAARRSAASGQVVALD